MDFQEGEIALHQVAGVDVIVEVIQEADADGMVIVKRGDLPQYPVHGSGLRRPEPDFDVGEALDHLEVGTLEQWIIIVENLRGEIARTHETLSEIQEQFGSGHRKPDSKLVRREKEHLASLYHALNTHLCSVNAILRRGQ